MAGNNSLSDVSYDDLPSHLVMSILMRLSPRDLLISMRVCKSWRNMIRDDAYFAYMHHEHSRRRASITDVRKPSNFIIHASHETDICREHCYANSEHFYRYGTVKFREDDDDDGYRVVTACDGLLLLAVVGHYRRLLVWNPAIRKIKHVPRCPEKDVYSCFDFPYP